MDTRRARALRPVGVAIAWPTALMGTALVIMGAAPHVQLMNRATAMAAAFIPYGVLAWAFVSLVALTSRRWTIRALGLLTVGLLVLQVLWTRPYWPQASPRAPSATEQFTVMTLNTYYGWADATGLVEAVELTQPDVVVLSEITTRGWTDLAAAGWAEMFPHHVGQPGGVWQSDGLMVFARRPLTELGSPALSDPAHVVRVDGPVGPVTIVAVHVANPWLRFADWRADHEALQDVVGEHRGEALLVVGDLNAVREHEPLQRLRDLGLSHAAEQSGAGWLPTFPAQRLYGPLTGLPYPSLIAIDHVLVSPDLVATRAEAFRVDGTDHRGLVATIAVR